MSASQTTARIASNTRGQGRNCDDGQPGGKQDQQTDDRAAHSSRPDESQPQRDDEEPESQSREVEGDRFIGLRHFDQLRPAHGQSHCQQSQGNAPRPPACRSPIGPALPIPRRRSPSPAAINRAHLGQEKQARQQHRQETLSPWRRGSKHGKASRLPTATARWCVQTAFPLVIRLNGRVQGFPIEFWPEQVGGSGAPV